MNHLWLAAAVLAFGGSAAIWLLWSSHAQVRKDRLDEAEKRAARAVSRMELLQREVERLAAMRGVSSPARRRDAYGIPGRLTPYDDSGRPVGPSVPVVLRVEDGALVGGPVSVTVAARDVITGADLEVPDLRLRRRLPLDGPIAGPAELTITPRLSFGWAGDSSWEPPSTPPREDDA